MTFVEAGLVSRSVSLPTEKITYIYIYMFSLSIYIYIGREREHIYI